MRSIAMFSHFHTGISGCTSKPDGRWCLALILRQVRHFVTYTRRHPSSYQATSTGYEDPCTFCRHRDGKNNGTYEIRPSLECDDCLVSESTNDLLNRVTHCLSFRV
ncbi:hypothetical protein HanIR_Chr17g0896161 [Helianthus annuus]|nr:hypothetical protein HanIR_Chr17g0896161 [Helianthus annuus]